jgi:NitT/TauT family transport system ATP-binding protein
MARGKNAKKAARKPIISVRNVTIRREASGAVLENISFDVYEGEFLSVIGASGCGKTTLLKAVAGLIKPKSGQVIFRGKALAGPDKELGLVYQNYALFPWRTALENVEFGLEIRDVPRHKRRIMAQEALALFDMNEHADKYPAELSGGMQQRVAIARQLVNNPSVVLLDESFSALDVQTRYKIESEIMQIQQNMRKTFVLVTHMVDQALYLSDRAIVLSNGKVKRTIELAERKPRNKDEPAFRKKVREVENMIRPLSRITTFVKDLETIR